MGGRISDVAVYEKDSRIFYVASASGGLFKTQNKGTTFEPVFDKEGSISLGAVAVSAKDPNIVWVGTGEASSRNSVAWGDGVYKSTDGGKTWTNMGLKDTLQVGKIVIDPEDPNVVMVAAVGNVWGPSPRGLYKTTDGGKTWKRTLYVDDSTGAIDLKMDPHNHNVLLCSMWQRLRKPYDFTSGGPGSGLYRSLDGGNSWHKVTTGLPTSRLGRIGVSYFRSNPKIVFATVEYKGDPKTEKSRPKDDGVVKDYAGGTFRSDDGGESWKRVSYLNPRPFYFSLPVVDPNDSKRLYVFADGINLSVDGGTTFKELNGSYHPDCHAVWVDPNNSNDLLVGNDGGLYWSHDKGTTWDHLNSMSLGQYYAVAVDMRKPYWIYGGLQDNSCWGIPTQTSRGGVAFYDSVGLGGGDGFHCQVDPTDWGIVYSESQGGGAVRVDLRTGQSRSVRPRPKNRDEKLRFNWSTPFILSPHNASTLYFGGNKLFKSINRGDSYTEISPDLSTNDPAKLHPGAGSVTPEDTGAETHCTIITISESPRRQGLLYVGTDDGLVWTSPDDGKTWTEIGHNIPNLPRATWCSRVVASKHVEGRAYATFDGHRGNDFRPYVYVTEDFGKTWKSLANGLPDYDSVYVIQEGEKNPDLLYLGSEMSLRVSLDRGQSWGRVHGGFPTVAVHDLLVHPRDLDLVIGTHGRSLWTLDVSGLEQLTTEELGTPATVFTPQNVLILGRTTGNAWAGDRVATSRNTQPGTRVQYWLKAKAKDVKLTIMTPDGKHTDELKATNEAGLNVVPWDGRIDFARAPGDYRVVLTVDGKDYFATARVEQTLLNP